MPSIVFPSRITFLPNRMSYEPESKRLELLKLTSRSKIYTSSEKYLPTKVLGLVLSSTIANHYQSQDTIFIRLLYPSPPGLPLKIEMSSLQTLLYPDPSDHSPFQSERHPS